MSTTPAVGPRPPLARLDSLTGLRWWAAFAVFGYHMANLAPLPYVQAVLHYGNFGVAFFFVLSGFVLTWSARPETTARTFWWRRFARIYPLHFLTLLLAIVVFYRIDPDPAQWWIKPLDIGLLLLSVVLLQGWSNEPRVLFSGNPAAWTLTCEAFFYAVHPFVNRGVRRLGLRGSLALCAGALAVAVALRVGTLLWPDVFGLVPLPISRVTEFILGMGLASALLNGWRVRLSPLWVLGVTGVILVALTIASNRPVPAAVSIALAFTPELIIALCGAMIATVAARDLRGDRSLLRSRVLIALGDCSYAFYLVHATVLYAIRELVGFHEPSWVNLLWFALVGGIATGLAALLHYFVERPVEKRLRGWWDRRLAARNSSHV
jgi:peptidoglycan/LPS O-acetylase OafA/YrhL